MAGRKKDKASIDTDQGSSVNAPRPSVTIEIEEQSRGGPSNNHEDIQSPSTLIDVSTTQAPTVTQAHSNISEVSRANASINNPPIASISGNMHHTSANSTHIPYVTESTLMRLVQPIINEMRHLGSRFDRFEANANAQNITQANSSRFVKSNDLGEVSELASNSFGGQNNQPDHFQGPSQGNGYRPRFSTSTGHTSAQPPNLNHLKTSDFKVPVYIGSQDYKTPFDHIMELERFQRALGYDENAMLNFVLPVPITHEAYRWYREEYPFNTWEEFKTKLRAEFQAVGYKEDLRRELEDRTQGPDEPLTVYIRIIMDYYERLGENTPEATVVDRILRQMHPEYQQVFFGKQVRTLRELKLIAQTAPELIKSSRTYRPPPSKGTLEPSLSWKPSNMIASTKDNTGRMRVENPDAPKLQFSALDPFSYHHCENAQQVSFQTPSYSAHGFSPPIHSNLVASKSPPTILKRPNSPVNSSVSKEESERMRRWSEGNNGSTTSAKIKGPCNNCGGLDHFMRDFRAGITGAKSPTLANKSVNAIADISEIEFVGFTAQNISAPYIQVKILDRVYYALLDTGSPCSFIGDEILKDIEGLEEKAVACVRKFRFLKGEHTCLKVISLEVDYLMGKIPLDLYFVPDRGKTIILGRDFLYATDINIYVGLNGWTHEDENGVFANFEDFDLQLSYNDCNQLENKEEVETFEIVCKCIFA